MDSWLSQATSQLSCPQSAVLLALGVWPGTRGRDAQAVGAFWVPETWREWGARRSEDESVGPSLFNPKCITSVEPTLKQLLSVLLVSAPPFLL